jgi:putative ATP-binding cassette transporter
MKIIRDLTMYFSVLLDWTRGVKRSRVIIAIVVITGAISGFGFTALIAIINAALSGRRTPALIWGFIALCLVIPAAGFASQALLIRLTLKSAYNMRMWLSRRILSAPLRLLEQLGVHRLFATLTDDIPAVIDGITNLPFLLKQIIIIAGCLIYLGWLSRPLLLMVLVYMVVGILSYHLPLKRAMRHFRLMREQWDLLFKALRALTEGTKELKLNRPRRREFLSRHLEPTLKAIQHYGIQGNTLAFAASHWGLILFFVFIGMAVFGASVFLNVDSQTLTGYTLTVLYLNAPLSAILNAMPNMSRAYVAFQKINELSEALGNQPSEDEGTAEESSIPPWEHLELDGVTHTYHHDGGMHEFTLGPLYINFQPGELVFVTGGNGSGKTTLAKLITGLYAPESGEIRLNGKPTTFQDRDDYRQHFSVVFSDSYIFENLLGFEATTLDVKAGDYLTRLQLNHKVKVENGALSTINLSQGQRKRLALLTAYLEDRPIYLFDEWAADQDVMFKEIFYHQILPELKARGKMVLVISHDDRYYHVADRIIRLDYGQLVDDQRRSHAGTAFGEIQESAFSSPS